MHDQILLARQLEYFEVLYRLRNYSSAARAIPITYQGLRKAIGKLETELGVDLFVTDDDNSLKPTPYADLLHDSATKWAQDIRNLKREIVQRKSDEAIVVTLCTTIGSLAILGYHLVSDFNDSHADLKIEAIDYSDTWVDQALLDDEFGIGIVASPFDEGLEVIALKSISSAVYVPTRSPLADKKVIDLADLDGENITIPEPHYKSHEFYRSEFKRLGIEPKSIMNCSDMLWSFTFANEGRGLGVSVEKGYGLPLRSDSVKLIPLRGGYTQIIGIAHRKGRELTNAESVVRNFFVKQFASA